MKNLFTTLSIALCTLILSSPFAADNVLKAQAVVDNEIELIDTLRVVSWNIQSRNLELPEALDSIAQIINEREAQWVALRQVDSMTTRIGEIDVMQEIADRTGLEPLFHQHFPHQGGGFGNGVLTSLPYSEYHEYLFFQPEGHTQRGLQHMLAELNGIPLVLINTWLGHESQENRNAAVDQIFEIVEQYFAIGAPYILAGNMNEEPDDPASVALKTVFTDVWEEIGDGPGYTHVNDVRFDAMFYYNLQGAPIAASPLFMEVIETDIGTRWHAMYSEYEVTKAASETSTRQPDQLPESFQLDQNYPNPFNPVTSIRFNLPESSNVMLDIYSVTGQHVTTLVNDTRAAGQYTVHFDATGLSSGVYFYTLRAGDYMQTRRFTLIK